MNDLTKEQLDFEWKLISKLQNINMVNGFRAIGNDTQHTADHLEAINNLINFYKGTFYAARIDALKEAMAPTQERQGHLINFYKNDTKVDASCWPVANKSEALRMAINKCKEMGYDYFSFDEPNSEIKRGT